MEEIRRSSKGPEGIRRNPKESEGIRRNLRKLEGAQRPAKAHKEKVNTISGGNGKRDPPVPIPNTAVKPLRADGTWLETARESRSSPEPLSGQSFRLTGFFVLYKGRDLRQTPSFPAYPGIIH